jgi:hypothetical protein
MAWIPGLRAFSGRFAAMADRGLAEIQLTNAERLAEDLQVIYRDTAPRGERPESQSFQGSLEARAEASLDGFAIRLGTTQPDLRRWLKEGTGIYGPRGVPIVPINSTVLHWTDSGGEHFARSVRGMPANDWEVRAHALAEPLLAVMGNKIGVQVIVKLAGG